MRYVNTMFKERIGWDFYCDIANNIVNERHKNNMTQKDLAEKSGIALSRIVSFENVKTRICLEVLKKIADALGVTVNYLIDAEIDSQIGDCLYTICSERCEGNDNLTLYQKATSKRMAFLLFDEKLKKLKVGYSERERFIVTLVGVPVTDKEIRDRFPKRQCEDLPIEKD